MRGAGCGICAHACAEQAIACDDSGRPVFRAESWLFCGERIRCCPAGAWQAEAVGWIVRVGGKQGQHPIDGATVAQFLPDEVVEEVIGAVLHWFRTYGAGKGPVRLSTLLLDEQTWAQFVRELRPVLGRFAVADPRLLGRGRCAWLSAREVSQAARRRAAFPAALGRALWVRGVCPSPKRTPKELCPQTPKPPFALARQANTKRRDTHADARGSNGHFDRAHEKQKPR